MLKTPTTIPIESKKLVSYMFKKYSIDLQIDGEFIENVLSDDYDYHIYKKGKKKNTLKIFKSKKNKKNVIKDKLTLYKFENVKNEERKTQEINFDIINETKIKKINNQKNIENKKEIEIRYVIGKSIKYNLFENYKKSFIDYKNKYQILNNFYHILLEKHKIMYDFFINISWGLGRLINQLNNKKYKEISELEYEEIKVNIKKIKPSDILINKLY